MKNLAEHLISCATLAASLDKKDLDKKDYVLIDCRFDLADPEAGYRAYLQAHIPGAVYAHLDTHLSGRPTTDCGRHPLPAPEDIKDNFECLGVADDSQVIVYDDQGGMLAARAWWMLRYIGHDSVAILDGGWSSWQHAGLAVAEGQVEAHKGTLTGTPISERLVVYADLNPKMHLVDAREPGRFRGEYEPIDALAGHIPGADNHFFQDNLDESGEFLPPDTIRDRFRQSLGRLPDEQTVHYCGSGVSACHNIFAQVSAGMPEPKLYCGSWSEWAKLTAENEGSDERA
jgi:thiosulfate/3-mercaptopyruvate sulfurtransferase